MVEALLLVGATGAAVCGMAWLALTNGLHWTQVCGAQPPAASAVRRLRMAGGAGLGASLLLCLAVDHASMASLVWVMTLSVAALGVALLLAYRPHWLRWLVVWVKQPQ